MQQACYTDGMRIAVLIKLVFHLLMLLTPSKNNMYKNMYQCGEIQGNNFEIADMIRSHLVALHTAD